MAVGAGLRNLETRQRAYTNGLKNANNAINSVKSSFNGQLSILEKLRLKYYEVTYQSKKYSDTLNKIKTKNNNINNTLQKTSDFSIKAGTAIMGLGGAMYLLGEATGNSAVTSMADYAMKIGAVVTILPTLLSLGSALIKFIKAVTFANIKLAATTLLAWLPVITAISILSVSYTHLRAHET